MEKNKIVLFLSSLHAVDEIKEENSTNFSSFLYSHYVFLEKFLKIVQ